VSWPEHLAQGEWLVESSDGQAVPTTNPLYVPVNRPVTWAGLETLITLIEMSGQPRARHDFNLLRAGLSTGPGVSRAAASALGPPPLPHRGGAAARRTWARQPTAMILPADSLTTDSYEA
jgi:hypothetical protein